MSLVTRLSRSPSCWRSTKASGKRLILPSTSARIAYIVRCTTPARIRACRNCSTAELTYNSTAHSSTWCSSVKSMPLWLSTTPLTMMSVAWPSSFGPSTASVTLVTASATTAISRGRSGAIRPSSRRTAAPMSFDFSVGMPIERPGPGWRSWAAGGRYSAVAVALDAARRRLVAVRSPDGSIAHAASSVVICDSTISTYVGHVSNSSRCVPNPTVRPSSSTRIRSAVLIVDTRWATTITVLSAVTGASAARRRASVARSSAENESSKR